MPRRHSGRDLLIPWNNRWQYLTARSENAGLASHQILLKGRLAGAKSLFRRDLKSHYGCVNAIEFSNDGLMIISGGDDRRVLVWNVDKALTDVGTPEPMKGEHNSNIFCLAINKSNTKIYSGGNDEQVVVHDIESGQTVDVFQHDEAVYGLSNDPNNENIFASACDDGRVLVYDTREPATSDPFELATYTSSMHAVMYNPSEPRLLATANAKEGLALWDIRKPKECLMRYGGQYLQQSCMSVRINKRGTHLLALRRRLPPVLYAIGSTDPLCDLDHDGYYNSCTMKSCAFAGPNDEYVLSGSDDFNLYMWKIPDDLSQRVYVKEAHLILHGHRSIVNQVRYNYHSGIIISSGVEKVIKVWSPFVLKNGWGDIDKVGDDSLTERPVFTHEEYINLVLRSGLGMNHDYSSQSVEEDPRMMAFFDSLVQREHEYSSSDEDLSSNEIELYDSILQVTRQRAERYGASEEDDQEGNGGQIARWHSSDSSDSEFSPFALAFASVLAAQETDASHVLEAHERSEQSRLELEDDPVDPVLRYQRIYGPRGRLHSRKSISEIIAHNRKEVMRAAKLRFRHQQDVSSVCVDHDGIHMLSTSDSDTDSNEPAGPSILSSEDIGHVLNKRSAQQQRAAYKLKRLQALRTRLVVSDTDSSSSDASPVKKRPRGASESTSMDSSDKTDDECGGSGRAEDESNRNGLPVNVTDSCSSTTTHSAASQCMAKGKSDFKDKAGPCLQQKDGPCSHSHLLSSVSHSEPVASTSAVISSSSVHAGSTDHHRKSSDSDNRENSHNHRRKVRGSAGTENTRDKKKYLQIDKSSLGKKKLISSHSKRKKHSSESSTSSKNYSSDDKEKSMGDLHSHKKSKHSSNKTISNESDSNKAGDTSRRHRNSALGNERRKLSSSSHMKKKNSDYSSNKKDCSADDKNSASQQAAGVTSESSEDWEDSVRVNSSAGVNGNSVNDSAGDNAAVPLASCSAVSANSLTSTAVPSGHGNEDSSQPVWTEFKKFKKTLLRASCRQYRQNSSRRSNRVNESSDDDD